MYHYAGNNPVKYTDPDGRIQKKVDETVNFFPTTNRHFELGNSGRYIEVQWGNIKANDGSDIEIRLNFSDLRNENFNCHGYTFIDGRGWLEPSIVPRILQGDGYVETEQPQVGGVFVQFDDDETAFHSGKIISVENDSITVQEALGVAVFKGEDSKLYDTRKVTYKISDMGDVKFYKNQGDVYVE